MPAIPSFDPDGLLPPGDYGVSFDELRQSILVKGAPDPGKHSSWDKDWRKERIGWEP
jgi:hypothetical protein